MHFNTRLISAIWSEEQGRWNLRLERTFADDHVELFDDYADVFLQATGQLNNAKMPDLEGLESFRGKVVHTAQWPDEFASEQWKGKKMVVIGAGASSVQTTPG